jgi:hypothetical protein
MKRSWKRVFIFSFVIILSIAGISLAYLYKQSANTLTYTAPENTRQALVSLGNTLSDIDTDSDGLKDWEESIWGTDRNNSDTDGDGTPDGMEISLDRNPTVKGPNDSLEKFPLGSNTNPTDNTHSAILSRELFARYAQVKSETGTLTEKDQQEIIEAIIQNAESVIERPKEYTYASLTIINTPTPENLQIYSTNLKNTLLKNRPQNVGDELTLMAFALENRDNSVSKEMKAISEFYENTAKQMLSTPVPRTIAENHLSLINMYLRLAKNVLAFDQALKDPFVASVNLGDYVKNTEQFSQDLNSMKTYLENNGIYF